MAHIHKKTKDGRAYYYVRETARVNGKSKVVNQVYLGTAEKLMTMAREKNTPTIKQIQVQEFGALWIANQIEERVGVVNIIDTILPGRSQGPSLGEYFLYAAFNRMVDSTSKRALPEWYAATAVQSIRPVDVTALDSLSYCRRWSAVTEKDLQTIAKAFFQKIASLQPPGDGCFLFDTTNFYTFMASDTDSDLARRGKNKEGRNWLRQIGLALLVDRHSRLPFHYREYQGNCHDSKVFSSLLEELVGVMRQSGKQDFTLVIDKGMNSPENFQILDEQSDVHFITTYSPSFAEKLVLASRDRFVPVETSRNKRLQEQGCHDDCLLAWRTTGEYWGRERTVVVTYNPLTAAKKRYDFDKKLQKLQAALFEMRAKVKEGARDWKNDVDVRTRYAKLCADMRMPEDLFDLDFEQKNGKLTMRVHKNFYRIGRHIEKFGKNILVTDRADWSTDDIVRAALDRYVVEEAFRQSKNDDLVSIAPIRHWTDQTIRCHFLSCVIALAYLRLLELILAEAGYPMTAERCMGVMRTLHSCLYWTGKNTGKPHRKIEEPTPEQAAIFQAFGFQVVKGILQKAQVSTRRIY
jgi:transposase